MNNKLIMVIVIGIVIMLITIRLVKSMYFPNTCPPKQGIKYGNNHLSDILFGEYTCKVCPDYTYFTDGNKCSKCPDGKISYNGVTCIPYGCIEGTYDSTNNTCRCFNGYKLASTGPNICVKDI